MSKLENIPDESFMNYIKFVKKFLNMKNINPNEMDFMNEFAPDIDEIKNKIFGPLNISHPSIHDYEYLYIYLTTGQRPVGMKNYMVMAYETYSVKRTYTYETEVSSYFDSSYFTTDYVAELDNNEFIDMYDDSVDMEESYQPTLIDRGIEDIEEL